MGTTFQLVFYAESAEKAKIASDSAFAKIVQLNEIMSDYFPQSELNALNKTHAEWIEVSPELWEVLVLARKISRQSKGAFDVSVGPVVRLWRRARRRQALPDSIRLKKARNAVGFRYIKLQKRTQSVKLTQPNMRLDLGGIAKGYAVEAAIKALEAHGIYSALVDGGGDLQCSHAPPSKEGWTISLGETDEHILSVENTAIATSGDMYQYLEIDGKRYSHIINPHTGIGLTDQREVTVIASNATLADALASTFSVLSPSACPRIQKKYPGIHYRILIRQKEQVESYISNNFFSNH